LIIAPTVTPSKALAPTLRVTLARMASKAAQTAGSSGRLSITPPTSLLCVIVLLSSFATTGKPIWLAAWTASSIVRHGTLGTTGRP
jgi:hypothetical protein